MVVGGAELEMHGRSSTGHQVLASASLLPAHLFCHTRARMCVCVHTQGDRSGGRHRAGDARPLLHRPPGAGLCLITPRPP